MDGVWGEMPDDWGRVRKDNRAGPLHFSVICKTLRSCRSSGHAQE